MTDLAERLFQLMAYMRPGWEAESERLGEELWQLSDDELTDLMHSFWHKATEGDEGYPEEDIIAFWGVMSFPVATVDDDAASRYVAERQESVRRGARRSKGHFRL